MFGDVLLIKHCHKEAAKKLVPIILKIDVKRPVIAISGESGSGKSVLSHSIGKILKSMGIKVKVLTTDDFYKTLPAERASIRVQKGINEYVGPDEYDWEALNNVVNAFKTGKKVSVPSVDLLNDQVDILNINFKPIEILIMEGLYSISIEKTDLKIIIDIPYTKTRQAQLKRDKEPADQTRLKILKAEHNAFAEIKNKADVIISETYRVVKVK